jgi:hypothetical protein
MLVTAEDRLNFTKEIQTWVRGKVAHQKYLRGGEQGVECLDQSARSAYYRCSRSLSDQSSPKKVDKTAFRWFTFTEIALIARQVKFCAEY